MDDSELERQVEQYLANPKWASIMRTATIERHRAIFDTEYKGSWIQVNVRREEDTVEVQWRSHAAYNYSAVGFYVEVEYSSSGGFGPPVHLPGRQGDGRHLLKLEQGRTYCLTLIFTPSNGDPLVAKHIQLSVPLSPDLKMLLAKAVREEDHPSGKIRQQVDDFFEKQDTFDELLKIGVERIKGKKLESDDEQDQLEDLREHLEWLKEKFGM